MWHVDTSHPQSLSQVLTPQAPETRAALAAQVPYKLSMPKIVAYASRFDCIREAVYTTALRDGAQAITLPAVAAEMAVSVSSVRRLLSSAVHLPALGMDWVDRHTRTRRLASFHREYPIDQAWATGVNALFLELPTTGAYRDDAIVWQRLTLGFESHDWSRRARGEQQLLLATHADRSIPAGLPAPEREYEAMRLMSLVIGATDAVCSGAIRPDECHRLVRRHLDDLIPAWLANADGEPA